MAGLPVPRIDFGVKFDAFKSHFFDRPVVDGLEKTEKAALNRMGASIRKAVRFSMRKARRKKLSEMSKDERRRFHSRAEYARLHGRPTPKRPYMPSAPGEPPRTRVGLIKKMVLYAYDPDNKSVVVGPAALPGGTGAPANLEYGATIDTTNGRVRIAPRPYMQPQLEVFAPQMPRFLAEAAATR